jgi:hypothetical protein
MIYAIKGFSQVSRSGHVAIWRHVIQRTVQLRTIHEMLLSGLSSRRGSVLVVEAGDVACFP